MNDEYRRPDVAQVTRQRLLEIIGNDSMLSFERAMRNSGAVLSGSFVLQCIMGKRWSTSDIDFFVPRNGAHEIKVWFTIESDTLENAARNEALMQNQHPPYRDIFTGGVKRTLDVFDFKINDRIFQLVVTNLENTNEICNWIVTDFDFPVIRNAVWVDSKNRWQSIVSDWNSIELQRFVFPRTRTVFPSLNRRLKYEERGFEVSYTNPRQLLENCTESYRDSYVVMVDFKNRRPNGILTSTIEEKDFTFCPSMRNFNEEVFAWRSQSCEVDCVFEMLSAWHLHTNLLHDLASIVWVDKRAFDVVRIAEVVIGLQSLRIPVLILCLILKYIPKCNSFFCKPVSLWKIVATIRHFKK